MPNYVLLLHDSGTSFPEMSAAEIQAVIQRYVAWRRRVQEGGRAVSGHKLVEGEGRLMRRKAGSATVTDGPYAEAREVIGGFSRPKPMTRSSRSVRTARIWTLVRSISEGATYRVTSGDLIVQIDRSLDH